MLRRMSSPKASVAADHPGIGIVAYDSLHFVVENLERSRAFYTQKFDFKEVARAGDELTQRSGQQSVVFGAGDARVRVDAAVPGVEGGALPRAAPGGRDEPELPRRA